MAQIDRKRILASIAAIFFGAWEIYHWFGSVSGGASWTFGLGFATAALIFGFWDSPTIPTSTAAQTPRKLLEDAPGLEGIDIRLEELINEGQAILQREKKAAERIAHYHGVKNGPESQKSRRPEPPSG